MRWLLCLSLLLAGCASTRTGCLPMRVYTQDEQTALALAISPLEPNSVLVTTIEDYSAMRAANRACLKGK